MLLKYLLLAIFWLLLMPKFQSFKIREMSHNIKPGVATGEEVQAIFNLAKEKAFALPAVNVVGSNTINAVL